MAKKKAEWTEILIRQGLISPEQLNEAKQMAKESGSKLPDALIRLGYATGEAATRAIAEQNNLPYINIGDVTIPPSVIELVPESVARENAVLPLSEGDGHLTIIISDPWDIDTVDKLRFILNKQIDLALAPARRSWRPSTATMARAISPKVPTTCSRSLPTRPSTSPRRPTTAARAMTSTSRAPRSFGWCNSSFPRRCRPERRTSTSNRLRIAFASATGSTAC